MHMERGGAMAERMFSISEEQYYELLSFMISSAYLFYQGEQYEELYPSMRMMDVAQRLTKVVASHEDLPEDSWLPQFIQSCEEGFALIETDDDAFRDFIDASMLNVARLMKARMKGTDS